MFRSPENITQQDTRKEASVCAQMKKSNEESSRRNFQLPWQPQRKRNSATTETDLKKQHSGSDIGPETFIVREAVKLQFVTQHETIHERSF